MAGLAPSSRFKGVSRVKRAKPWHAKITISGKTTNLGRFLSEDDAARAYDLAALGADPVHAVTNASLGLLPSEGISKKRHSSIFDEWKKTDERED